MNSNFADLAARYHKLLEVIQEEEEHGLVCPKIACSECPMYEDDPETCLFFIENGIYRAIEKLEELL